MKRFRRMTNTRVTQCMSLLANLRTAGPGRYPDEKLASSALLLKGNDSRKADLPRSVVLQLTNIPSSPGVTLAYGNPAETCSTAITGWFSCFCGETAGLVCLTCASNSTW